MESLSKQQINNRFIPIRYIGGFFDSINNAGVDYLLIKNICDQLPSNFNNGKDIDILVKLDCKDKFEKFMSKNFLHLSSGTDEGWIFGYGLVPYQVWKCKNIDYNLYIDACFALCCRSLVPKIWIPLDKKIQEFVWDNRYFDEVLRCYQMDNRTTFVYLIIRCVFDKKEFSDRYVIEIEKYRELLRDDYVNTAFSLVFFRFTPKLISLINRKQYNKIIDEYMSFAEY